MSRVAEDLLGNDHLVLEYSMRDPNAGTDVARLLYSCSFLEDTDTEDEEIVPMPVTCYANLLPIVRMPRNRNLAPLKSEPPFVATEYDFPIIDFRRFLREEVDPAYHSAWFVARRRLQSRRTSMERRRRLGSRPRLQK